MIQEEKLTIELACAENFILEEIADERMIRKQIALTYALCMIAHKNQKINWKKVNGAIMERWSEKALQFIKTRAWQLIREKK